MGVGGSKMKEELAAAQAELASARARAQTLEQQSQALQAEVQGQASALRQSEAALVVAGQQHAEDLRGKEEELQKAVKQREIAEELRRSDALLAKRIMCAQLKQAGLGPGAEPDVTSIVAGGSMAAQLALAAEDEVQLRRTLLEVGEQLGVARAANQRLAKAQLSERRRELCDSIWAPDLCDVSVALQRSPFTVLGGLRLPRTAQPGQLDGNGLSPGVAVLRHFGDASMQGPWAAAGGSLLWDARAGNVSALKVAVSGQPTPHQTLSLGFDETGFVNGSLKASLRDALSLRVNAKVDVNRKQRAAFGLQLLYEMD